MTTPSRPVVLCVDDDPDILAWMQAVLGSKDLQAVVAGGGRKALEAVPVVMPDLILLDLHMPDLSGFEVCARLQEIPQAASVPIAFITASEDLQDKVKAFDLGVADYLVKPLREASFLEKVEQLLTVRRRWLSLKKGAEPVAESADRDLRWDQKLRPAEWTRFKESLLSTGRLSGEARSALLRCAPSELYLTGALHGLEARQILEVMARQLQMPIVQNILPEQVSLGVLPTNFCKTNLLVPVSDPKHPAAFVLSNPFNWEVLDAIRRTLSRGQAPHLMLAEPQLLTSLLHPQAKRTARTTAMADIEAKLRVEYQPERRVELTEATNESSAPLIQLVNNLIETAHLRGASDVHLEPSEEEVCVRYRIDGDLQVVNRLRPARLINPIIARLKVMAELDITERRLPQDGRIAFKPHSASGADFDLRVATIPVHHGEKCVLRIIDKQKSVLPLKDLGFSARNLESYRERIANPYGMILHAGPTGSGKSMSLYAALNELKTPSINIQTAEDPIEYSLPGISQTQVNPEIGFTFQRALRSFLRLDPDVILVGEIRDHETARMAVEASLTGHLLLSTLHANDATSTVARFIEMGIEPYMISSSLLVVCAQRLIRRLCPDCKEPYAPDRVQRALVGLPAEGDAVLYRARGCARCSGTGYRGRTGVHEILAPNDAFRAALVQKGATAESLKKLAVQSTGMTTLFWDAMEKVRAGHGSVEDALANVRQDDFDSRPLWMREEQHAVLSA